MQKKKLKAPRWIFLLKGVLTAFAGYVAGICLLAGFVLRGTVPERYAFSGIALLCVLATTAGCAVSLGKSSNAALPTAMITAGGIALVLLAVSLCLPGGVNWAGEGGGLLGCTVFGGLLAGLLGRRKSRRSRILRGTARCENRQK